jgi:hypothetical protein
MKMHLQMVVRLTPAARRLDEPQNYVRRRHDLARSARPCA